MKLILTASVLASILSLYSSNTFSANVNDLSNYKQNKQVSAIGEEGLSNDELGSNNRYMKSVDYMPKIVRAWISGQSISYMWSSLDELGKSNLEHDISGSYDNLGLTYDAILRVGAELKSVNSDVKYGADLQVALPIVKGMNFEKKAALNRGSKLFIATPYGDFSIGCQEGVESIMKLDASSIIAGDESNGWTQHIRDAIPEKKKAFVYEYPFILSPGLYSENLFRSNDNAVLNSEDRKDLINNLPLRLNYQSPSFMGLRFGVSYSPTGYEFDFFSKKFNKKALFVNYMTVPFGEYVEKNNGKEKPLNFQYYIMKEIKESDVKQTKKTMEQLKSDAEQVVKEAQLNTYYSFLPVFFEDSVDEYNIFSGSKYEHILSGGVAFNYNYSDIKFSTSVVGEYAHSRLYVNAKDYRTYTLSYDLKGLSIGSVINYNNISFAGAYGYLGESGFVDRYYYCRYITPQYERPGIAYYWDMGLSYQYKSYYFSIAYFKGRKSDNVLQDINLGFEYNLLQRQGKMKCKLFGNYHRYKFSEVAVFSDNKVIFYNHTIVNSAKESGKRIRKKLTDICKSNCLLDKEELIMKDEFMQGGFRKQKHDGSGNVLLIGMKLEF